MNPDVLVCGAGPTGLFLALRLIRAGVRVRLIDAAAEPGTRSRALVVHARTLELYRQMGLDHLVLEHGRRFVAVNLWVRGRKVAHAELGVMGQGLSPFPFMTVLPQDRHERLLIAELERQGVAVERSAELVDFTQTGRGVRARWVRASGEEEACEVAYLAGCDGSHSRVRELVGGDFSGGTYDRVFYVADIEAASALDGELHVALDDVDFLGVFPLAGGTTGRLIGTIRAEQEGEREALRWEDVSWRAAQRLGIHVERVNWFSTYRVHHRVAQRFADRRVFLLGDAAHVHSPVGGQGLNTGLGDAANLAWKLAEVLHARASPALLETYEPERRAFALGLVATTDRAFTIATSPGPLARFVRLHVVPRALPSLLRFDSLRRFMFRTVSQIAIDYRASPLSGEGVGAVHGGDRLPWVEDNYAVLDGLSWQVHVYGIAPTDLVGACRAHELALHVFEWRSEMGRAGFVENAGYLIRPDGHVACATRSPGASFVGQRRSLTSRATAATSRIPSSGLDRCSS